MESLTYFKDVKSTPKKLRMYLNEIKKLAPQEALDYLMYSNNKQSKLYYKAIHSAIANATNTLKVSPDMLQFKLFTVEEGRKLKRYKAGARGSARPRMKRFSHIKIILVEKEKDSDVISVNAGSTKQGSKAKSKITDKAKKDAKTPKQSDEKKEVKKSDTNKDKATEVTKKDKK